MVIVVSPAIPSVTRFDAAVMESLPPARHPVQLSPKKDTTNNNANTQQCITIGDLIGSRRLAENETLLTRGAWRMAPVTCPSGVDPTNYYHYIVTGGQELKIHFDGSKQSQTPPKRVLFCTAYTKQPSSGFTILWFSAEIKKKEEQWVNNTFST